jgi:protein CpxP
MKKILAALALALGLGGAASPAFAQEHGAQQHREHAQAMAAHMERMHAQLELNDAQVARLRQVHATHMETMRAQCEQIRAAGQANAETQQQRHAQMQRAMESAHRDMLAVLTAEQRARLEQIHAEHARQHGGDRAAHAGHAEHARSGEHASADAAKMHEMHAGMCHAAAPARSPSR